MMLTYKAHGLLLWRQTKNQVFQDDVEEKEKKGRIVLETYIDVNIYLQLSLAKSSSSGRAGLVVSAPACLAWDRSTDSQGVRNSNPSLSWTT